MCGFVKLDENLRESKNSSALNVSMLEAESSLDIYEQEFFLHSYSMLIRDKKNSIESKEGFTYVTQSVEQTISSRLLNFVPAKDAAKWQIIISIQMKKIKLD